VKILAVVSPIMNCMMIITEMCFATKSDGRRFLTVFRQEGGTHCFGHKSQAIANTAESTGYDQEVCSFQTDPFDRKVWRVSIEARLVGG
jgi:hypothetical protein